MSMRKHKRNLYVKFPYLGKLINKREWSYSPTIDYFSGRYNHNPNLWPYV